MGRFALEFGAITDKGNIKPSNQDNILVQIGEHNKKDFGLFVVCDGLGGLAFGEVASVIAVKNFKKWWDEEVIKCIKEDYSDGDIILSLKKVIGTINLEILDYSKKISQRVGTTISALLIIKSKYYIVHVGDSRIYKLSNKIEQVTMDHSFVAEQVRKGRMTMEQARNSNQKNLLLQCVGTKENIEIDSKVGTLKWNESFLLSSDGFYNKFLNKEMETNIRQWRANKRNSLQEMCKELLNEVKRREERDNISLIIVTLEKEEEEENAGFFKKFLR